MEDHLSLPADVAMVTVAVVGEAMPVIDGLLMTGSFDLTANIFPSDVRI